MGQPKYTHFVPLGEESKHLKKLLELPESDTSPPKLVKAYNEMLKEPQGKEPVVVDSTFKEASQQYLNAPKANKGLKKKKRHLQLLARTGLTWPTR